MDFGFGLIFVNFRVSGLVFGLKFWFQFRFRFLIQFRFSCSDQTSPAHTDFLLRFKLTINKFVLIELRQETRGRGYSVIDF